MQKPNRPCGTCGKPVFRNGRCEFHYRQAERRRGTSTQRGYSADELAKLEATQPEGLLHLERKVCTLLDQGEMDLGSIEADMMPNGLTVKQAYTVSVDAILNQCPDHLAALQ